MTVRDLEAAFALYFGEMKKAEDSACYWSMLHVVAALPDICASLEGKPRGHSRHLDWCSRNFPPAPPNVMSPTDRYQLRCALLHEGSTLPDTGQYVSFSFVEPGAAGPIEIHGAITEDTTRGGTNLALNIKVLADETAAALRRWFRELQQDAGLNAVVQSKLPRLARIQRKVIPSQASPTLSFGTTSST